MNQIYRQGDLLIERIAAVPTGLRQEPSNILAEGEATGHAHRAVGSGVRLFRATDGQLYLRVARPRKATAEPAQVVHDEHAPIPLAPGAYRVRRQREYVRGEIRRVAD